MKYRKSALSAAVIACIAFNAQAQEASDLDTVTVTGYRVSLEKSQAVKRSANSIVDAISAEDIGKFPDTNAAESLSHLPGITVDRQFGEGEKVSINGTDPALNRVLVNGQTIASGDWGGNPTDTSGRTFNYTLLSPEIIGLMEVYKTPEARIDEGSIGGTVIVHTRRPLDLPRNTLRGTVGYNYNDRSEDGNPRASLLWSWKNAAEDLGFLISATHDKQSISRAGLEYWGYTTGLPDTAVISGEGDPAAAKLPVGISSSYFQQDRERDGLQAALQWKPNENNEINLTGIYVKGKYDNFSQARYICPACSLGQITSATIDNGYVVAAEVGGDAYAQHDFNLRKSEVETKSLNLRHDWSGESWVFTTQAGVTSAKGGKDPEYLMKTLLLSGGFDFEYDARHTVVNYDNDAASNWGLAPGQQYGGQYYETSRDKERYFQFDATHDVAWGPINQIQVGYKYTNHDNGVSSRGNAVDVVSALNLTEILGGMSPSGLYDGLGAGGDLASWPVADLGKAIAYFNSLAPRGPYTYNYGPSFDVKEITTALYAQANFESGKWRGNLGVRYVDTSDKSLYWVSNGSGGYDRALANRSFYKPLPSFNLAYELTDDMIARFSAAKVMARPRYGQLAGTLDLNDQDFTGGGGNVDLEPYEATNYDLAFEWYFAPSSMLGAEIFRRDISNYVVTNTFEQQLTNPISGVSGVYSISRPINVADASATGVSLIYQQAFDNGFGINANYTYTDTDTSTDLFLPYVSKNAYTVTPYFEKGPFSVRVNYSYRSEYYNQVGRQNASVFADAYKQLDLIAGYQFNEMLGVTFSASNLLDDTYYWYDTQKRTPLGLYKSGRNYQVAFTFKF
ncbi:TonB-dependent receptor [Pseudoxanthomonas sp. z9]|uniref:TonB-dependent receptor n=1 Tax=Pseudoxanthomonas sp. z9 TaxID=2584942 RepID=UPI0011445A88|nr:TonB-dependent receptor [Pseudoxanthomonas sp. z9]